MWLENLTTWLIDKNIKIFLIQRTTHRPSPFFIVWKLKSPIVCSSLSCTFQPIAPFPPKYFAELWLIIEVYYSMQCCRSVETLLSHPFNYLGNFKPEHLLNFPQSSVRSCCHGYISLFFLCVIVLSYCDFDKSNVVLMIVIEHGTRINNPILTIVGRIKFR